MKHLQRSLASTRFPLARRLAPFRTEPRGHRPLSPDDLAINFSHVLHEPADHPTVLAAVRAAGKPLRVGRNPEIIHDATNNQPVDCWLVPSVGFPQRLPDLLEADPAAIILIDSGTQPAGKHRFFNAPATLSLPPTAQTVGIAALIRRPGGGTLQLITRGPFRWREEEHLALRELESLIQAHADQWRPCTRLWEAGCQPQRS